MQYTKKIRNETLREKRTIIFDGLRIRHLITFKRELLEESYEFDITSFSTNGEFFESIKKASRGFTF